MSGAPQFGTSRVGTSLLGVIDLRDGQAVHAVAGRRDQYRPLRIACCSDADPVALAEHYRELGVAGLYIADLDRIIDRSDSSRPAIDRLRALGLPTWIDQGIATAKDLANADAETTQAEGTDSVGETTWIVGTESLRSLDELREMAQQQAARQQATRSARFSSLAVSLDLRDGQVLFAAEELAEELAGRAPWEAAEMVAAAGIRRLIVLDLARVGTACGPATAPLCRQIKQRIPDLTICSGGGVRGAADAATLHDAGCDLVLAGTWLHSI